jgi:hypothetical protein
MKQFFKKIFGKKEFYSIEKKLRLENAVKFKVPSDAIRELLLEKLKRLRYETSNFEIEAALKTKKQYEYNEPDLLAETIIAELNRNYSEYMEEFTDDQFDFAYFLGTEMLFSNSVEVIQEIVNVQDPSVGKLYYALVIKYCNDQYLYWKW